MTSLISEAAPAYGASIKKARGLKSCNSNNKVRGADCDAVHQLQGEKIVAMVRMFVSEWQALAGAARVSHTAEHARLQRKWVRKQIGLTIVAAGAMIVILHGMVHTMV